MEHLKHLRDLRDLRNGVEETLTNHHNSLYYKPIINIMLRRWRCYSRAVAISSVIRRAASTGSGALVMGRPTTR